MRKSIIINQKFKFMRRKHVKRLALVMLFATAVAVYFVACKKNIVTPIINNKPATENPLEYTNEAKRIVSRIKNFKTQLADKENVMRDDLHVPIDSALWDIESLFNASYAFPERKYIETVKQDIEFSIDVNIENGVSFGDVADLYDEIVESVRQSYANDGIVDNKSLMAVAVEKGENRGGSMNVKVHVITGKVENGNSALNNDFNPFEPSDCWYFGEYGGTCDDPSVFGDAAEIIEDTINYYYGGVSVPRPGYRQLAANITRIVLDGSEFVDDDGNPYIYYHNINSNPPLYLDYLMLNYYFNREKEVLLHLLPNELKQNNMLPEMPAFLEVDIQGLIGSVGNTGCVYHKNYVTYCSVYEIPSTVLANAVDLLK